MSDVTYYFDGHSSTYWINNPDWMVDNILTNYASTSVDGDQEECNSNTCPGTNLGTITKVEMRVYAYGDDNDRIDILPQWDFDTGDFHQTTPGSSPNWSVYVDITTDTNAPSPWTWSDVVNTDVRISKENVAKGNVMYCAKVEIRITYTPTGGVTRSYGYIFG